MFHDGSVPDDQVQNKPGNEIQLHSDQHLDRIENIKNRTCWCTIQKDSRLDPQLCHQIGRSSATATVAAPKLIATTCIHLFHINLTMILSFWLLDLIKKA